MPTLICNEPVTIEDVTQYKIFGLGSGGFADPLITAADPNPDRGFSLDLINLKSGVYTVTARALNGWNESAPSDPFEFTVPAAPSPPVGLSIV
jgi:hypothetical protein